jgi:hypothetical protein
MACPHAAGWPPLLVCVDHPAAGVMCMACNGHHQVRTPHGAFACDQLCSGCGARGQLDSGGAEILVDQVPVHFTDGRAGALTGAVWIFGASVCSR